MSVSVVMAVHNGLPYLPQAIDSILRQTYRELRLIVVDDGSTDASATYLAGVQDPRLKVVRLPRRSGQGAARNVGLGRCRSDYVALMDADDLSAPDRLERQVRFLERQPSIGLAGTRVEYLGESGKSGFAPPLALEHDQIRADLLAGRNALVNATLMFRATIIRALGGYRVDATGEDHDLFLRATEMTRAANLPEVLYLYRLRGESSSVREARALRLRTAHACENARRRAAGLDESAFDDFVRRQERSRVRRLLGALDELSAVHYRRALAEILDGRRADYLRLAAAAVVSPGRLLQRLDRRLRAARPPAGSGVARLDARGEAR